MRHLRELLPWPGGQERAGGPTASASERAPQAPVVTVPAVATPPAGVDGSVATGPAGPTAGDVVGRVDAPVADVAADGPVLGAEQWEQIVREHSARVYRLAYRLTGNRHDAEDLTQETFVRVFRSLSTYRPGTFEGWLHRITTNLFLDQARRRKRVRMDPLGDQAEAVAGSDGAGSPERGYEHANLDHDVQAALDALPPEFRAAVVLCDIEGLSYEEISVTLGVKLGTVRSRIHRGRAQLREALAHRAPRPATAPDGPAGPGTSADADADAESPVVVS